MSSLKYERPRIAGRDQPLLQARRREDEHLRADRHVQFLEQAAQKRQIAAQIDRGPFVPASQAARNREKRSSTARVSYSCSGL